MINSGVLCVWVPPDAMSLPISLGVTTGVTPAPALSSGNPAALEPSGGGKIATAGNSTRD